MNIIAICLSWSGTDCCAGAVGTARLAPPGGSPGEIVFPNVFENNSLCFLIFGMCGMFRIFGILDLYFLGGDVLEVWEFLDCFGIIWNCLEFLECLECLGCLDVFCFVLQTNCF